MIPVARAGLETWKLAARRTAVDGYAAVVTAAGIDRRRLRSLPAEDQLLIVNLHSVEPANRSVLPGLDPPTLDEFISWLQRHARVVTVAEAVHEPADQRPRVVLSFDDGYRDFADYVLPVLQRRGVRANQNVIPACVESGRPPWNVELLDALAAVDPARLAALAELDRQLPSTLALASPARFAELFTLRLKDQPPDVRQSVLAEVAERLPELEEIPPRPMLSLSQVKEIAREHEVGAHSFAHESMGLQTLAYFEGDLERCLTWFAQHGLTMGLYAFPNGSYREEQLASAEARGIRTLLVGERAAQRTWPALHRVTMFGRSARELRARVARALA